MVTLRTVYRPGRALGLALATLIAVTASTANAAGKYAPPEVVSGNVTRLRGTYMTKGEPATIELPSGGIIRFHANAEASLMTDPQGLMLLPGKKTATYSVILRKGRMDVELPEKSPPHIAVAVGTKSDTRIITLTGKTSLRAEGQNVTAISYQGLTTVTQGTKLARLPNNVKRVYQGKVGTVDQTLLSASSWAGGRKVWLALRGTVKVTGYTWAPVAGAVGYEFSLRDSQNGRSVIQSHVKEPRFENAAVELSPGQYDAQITAIDRDGFISPQGRKFDIRVVGVSLPPGAEIQKNDTITLGYNQQVSLNHAEGLTLTTADHRVNVPATSAFGLASQDHASILIHPPGGGDASTLTLVRREYLVRAWVGPKLVTWPLEPVELRIDLMDEQGNRLNPAVKLNTKVTIGVTPANVEWTRGDTEWHAQLPAQTGRGPWVVRLEVFDQYGVLVGRDFVEVTLTQVKHRKDVNPTNRDPSKDPLSF